MLELLNPCHCVQYPWKLTCGDYWSSQNKRKPLSYLKHLLRKCSGVSQKWWLLEHSHLLPLCSAPLKTYLVGISGAVGMKESHFLSKMCILRKCYGVSQKQWMLELSNPCQCFHHPWKVTCRDFWSSRNERKPLSKAKNLFWENASGVSQ